jgi:hypothetical protein
LSSDLNTSVIPESQARDRGKVIVQHSLGDNVTLDAEGADGLSSDQNTRVIPESQARDRGKVIVQHSLGDNVTLSTEAAGGLALDQKSSAIPESPAAFVGNSSSITTITTQSWR